ncbi:AIPR family protein [Vibrio mediterranei]
MQIETILDTREDILHTCKDDDGFIQQSLILEEIMPLLLETKVVDSEDINYTYYLSSNNDLKINGYSINNTGERLQIFIVDEDYIDDEIKDVNISLRSDYDKKLSRATKFISEALKDNLSKIQESEPVKPLVSNLGSDDGIKKFDVFEFFLISLTATVSYKSSIPQPRSIHFKDEIRSFKYVGDNGKTNVKDVLFLKRVIDLNYLANVYASHGRAEPLRVVFKDVIGKNIEVIKAADENDFESYLCVLDATILSDLYKRYSSQLLEKNVRSFLQFKGVNRGIKQTIKNEPDKFIAFNNGLTITATHAKTSYSKKSLYLESLEDFQIVNGGQTTASIYFSNKEGIDISKVKVMAKINIAKSDKGQALDDLISKISEYSNSQSRVSRVDLRSRSPKLIQLKKLSETIITPSGRKWFFERAKGDFNTQLRKNTNSSKLKRDFPRERRFTKELLAKYYCAWGDDPHLVKKGGEAIFRLFIEDIEPEESVGLKIDRIFYERLIAKILLFRTMEKVYGQGKYAIGQLRSAAVPYAISAIYSRISPIYEEAFLDNIWKQEDLSADFKDYLKYLLHLVNDLIKSYALSEDFGEYSKKEELWVKIKSSPELLRFLDTPYSKKMLSIG